MGRLLICQVCWPRLWQKNHHEVLDKFVIDDRRYDWHTVGHKVVAHFETKPPMSKLKGNAWRDGVYDKVMEVVPQGGVAKQESVVHCKRFYLG